MKIDCVILWPHRDSDLSVFVRIYDVDDLTCWKEVKGVIEGGIVSVVMKDKFIAIEEYVESVAEECGLESVRGIPPLFGRPWRHIPWIVRVDDLRGYVNPCNGELILPPQWDSAYLFHKGKALVSKGGKFFTINLSGKAVEEHGSLTLCEIGEGWASRPAMIKGNFIVMPYIDTAWPPPEGSVFCGLKSCAAGDDERHGGILEFSAGSAEKDRPQRGYVDCGTGRIVSFPWQDVTPFYEGRAVACKDGRFSVIDMTGTVVETWENAESCVVAEPQYRKSPGGGVSIDMRGRCCLKDSSGTDVYIWEKARTCAASGLHHNPSSGVEWTVPGVIEDGFVVIPCHGKRMSLTEYFGYPNEPPHRLLPFSLNGKWGYVLFKTGNVVVEPRWAKRPGGWGDIRVYWWKYRGRLGIHHPTRPYSPLKKDRCGFKDWDGNVVIEPVYDDAIDFYGEFTAAKLNGKWGLIDQKGNSVFPFDWDDVLNFWDYNCPAGPALDSRREELLPYFAFMRGNECCFFTPEWKPLIKPRESSLIYFPEK